MNHCNVDAGRWVAYKKKNKSGLESYLFAKYISVFLESNLQGIESVKIQAEIIKRKLVLCPHVLLLFLCCG